MTNSAGLFPKSTAIMLTVSISSALLMIVGLLLLSLQITENRKVGLENQKLIRSNTCILTIPAMSRTQADIDKCRADAGAK